MKTLNFFNFILPAFIVGFLVYTCADKSIELQQLKANPIVIHDTVYVVNDAKENKWHDCTPVVQVSLDKELWLLVDTLPMNYRYYRIMFRKNYD